MGDDHLCNMKEVGTTLIKMFNEMVKEFEEVRYVPQLKKSISVGALEVFNLEISGRDDVLKMLRGSMVVMKDDRHNNLYYLKGNTAAGQVTIFIGLDDDCIWL